MKNFIITLIFIITIPLIVNGQYNYSSSSKKAIKSYEEALTLFNRLDYSNAITTMQKAIKYDKNFIEAHLVLAEIYIESGDRASAIKSYKKTIDINPDFFPGMYLALAQLEMYESLFSDAKIHLEKFLSYKNLKPISRSQAKHKIKSCDFAIQAINNPVPFNPENMGENINTEYDEYWPSLTADEKTLIITRLVPKETSDSYTENAENKTNIKLTNKVQEDFFISVNENSFWSEAINAGEPLNTKGNEGAQTLLVNGKLMYFTACNRSDGKGRCDIYVSYLKNNEWTTPENIGSPVNSSFWEAQPSISPDGKILYFVSNRDGGQGNKDIWYSNLRIDNTWTKPVNLGENVNTKGQEQSPFIHSDNKTLYFASDGGIGMGGFDLYKVTKTDNGTWTEPVNLGYPINTVYDEIGFIVNAKGDKALFSSDRLEGKGRDIFQFELYKEARPNPVSYLKGIIFNKENKDKLQAHFELINLETKEVIMQAESDEITGEFLVCIPANNDYALNVSKKGYLFYSDNFSLKGVFEISDPYLKDIALNPIKIGEKLILRNIFYQTDSYELDERSVVELSKLLDFLEKNKTLKVEISGHTDNVGANNYNIELSENRAKSVVSFLIENGISKERLEYKGYGETQPLNTNDTEEGRSENRRTEIKIISSN